MISGLPWLVPCSITWYWRGVKKTSAKIKKQTVYLHSTYTQNYVCRPIIIIISYTYKLIQQYFIIKNTIIIKLNWHVNRNVVWKSETSFHAVWDWPWPCTPSSSDTWDEWPFPFGDWPRRSAHCACTWTTIAERPCPSRSRRRECRSPLRRQRELSKKKGTTFHFSTR